VVDDVGVGRGTWACGRGLCDVRRLFYRMMVHFIIINGGSITIIVI
jgi:hypothetical protein